MAHNEKSTNVMQHVLTLHCARQREEGKQTSADIDGNRALCSLHKVMQALGHHPKVSDSQSFATRVS